MNDFRSLHSPMQCIDKEVEVSASMTTRAARTTKPHSSISNEHRTRKMYCFTLSDEAKGKLEDQALDANTSQSMVLDGLIVAESARIARRK